MTNSAVMWWQQHWAELVGLLFVAFQAGGSLMLLRGVNRRLDRVNGRLDNHGERIGANERAVAVLEERTAR